MSGSCYGVEGSGRAAGRSRNGFSAPLFGRDLDPRHFGQIDVEPGAFSAEPDDQPEPRRELLSHGLPDRVLKTASVGEQGSRGLQSARRQLVRGDLLKEARHGPGTELGAGIFARLYVAGEAEAVVVGHDT